MYLPDGVLLRLNSRESVDWLIPTIRAISFLGYLLCSKAKTCDLCSEVSCLYIRNTKIINLRESSKGDSFLYCRYRSSGLRAPAARPTRGVFHRLEPIKNEWFVALRFWKYALQTDKARSLYWRLYPLISVCHFRYEKVAHACSYLDRPCISSIGTSFFLNYYQVSQTARLHL